MTMPYNIRDPHIDNICIDLESVKEAYPESIIAINRAIIEIELLSKNLSCERMKLIDSEIQLDQYKKKNAYHWYYAFAALTSLTAALYFYASMI